jgi:hypothetical protein
MMRPRTLLRLAPAVMAMAMLGAPPALAAAETKLEVNENCVESDWPCWATPGSSQPAAKVTIAAGGSITFVDSKTAANLAWAGAAPACEPGVPVAPTAPRTGWEGKCAFATPGTYKFESSTLWPEYTRYEVVVEGSAGGTTGEGGSKASSTPGTTPAGGSPASPLSGSPKIGRAQRGGAVKGSVQISDAGAGGRLEVSLIATAASLGGTGHGARVVGRFVSASVAAGRRSFSVKLDAKAKRALERRRHLALKVEITLTPVNGEATTLTRSVALQG